MKRLLIIGAGELGQQICHHVISDKQYEVVGFVDDWLENGCIVNGKPILGDVDDVIELFEGGVFDELLIGIGYKHLDLKEKLFAKYACIIPFGKFVHSSCVVDSTAEIGKGVVIYPGCIIDKDVCVEDNTLLNIGCVISHNTTIGSGTFVAPNVSISGFVKIGKNNFVGIGTVITDNVNIAEKNIIGAGSVVVNDISDSSGVFYGSPARFIKSSGLVNFK